MKRFLLAVIALASGVATSEEVSDDKIKSMIVGSECYIDNSRASERMFKNARRRCGDDTNRFARILCELAQTSDVHLADRMISRLGRHGTAAQLPFLYSMATNEQHGATAVKSILRIEGVTSNSVDVAARCLFSTNYTNRVRYEVCECLISQLAKHQDNRPVAEGVVLRFMSDYNIYHDWLDIAMKKANPTYSQSRRRLRTLRSIALRELDVNDIAYVTNAINELVAYPEADLPE